MKRMKCIGAQTIGMAVQFVPSLGLEVPCRRDEGPSLLRTFLSEQPIDSGETVPVQLSLFDT